MRYRIKEKIYGENIKKYEVQRRFFFMMFIPIPIWRTMKYAVEKDNVFVTSKKAIFNTKEEAEHFLLRETDDHIYLDSNINIYKTY